MRELILLVGPSGSGKSTYTKAHFDDDAHVIISSDDIREEILKNATDQSQNALIFNVAHIRVRIAMDAGKTAVLDATNIRSRERREAIKKTGADHVTALVFMPGETVSKERNLMRKRHVPEYVISRQYQILQQDLELLKSECDHIEYVETAN